MEDQRGKTIPTQADFSSRTGIAGLDEIRRLFEELGVMGQRLRILHQGITYRVCCDETSFVVYRVNEERSANHGVPGWPVCLVTQESTFEECSTPDLDEDACACGLDLASWLQLVSEHCSNRMR